VIDDICADVVDVAAYALEIPKDIRINCLRMSIITVGIFIVVNGLKCSEQYCGQVDLSKRPLAI